jgi:fructose-bisphosphate aldolase class II
VETRSNPRVRFWKACPFLFIYIERFKLLTLISRLDRIRKATKGRAQLVLHGTNTFPDDTMKGCIKGGMTRCNVNELVLYKYNKYVAENTGKVPLTELMGKGTALIQEQIEYQMDVMGSTGKA